MQPEQDPPVRVLVELRPALGGHAGIPQATRLLFRGLSLLDGVHVEGLLQSAERSLTPGLPPHRSRFLRPLSADQELNRLSRTVVAIETGSWDSYVYAALHTIGMAIKHLLGGKQQLTRFEAEHFRDFLWHRFFERTLAPEDFEIVTRAAFRIARVPWTAMHICALVTRKVGFSLYPRLNTSDFDVMICETPYPATVSRTTRLVIHYHDAIPILMPHTISDRRLHQAFHYRALRRNVERGAWFVCVSDATRRDLVSIFPQVEARSITIHNAISHCYNNEPSDPSRVLEIIRTRLNMRLKPPLDPGIRRRIIEESTQVHRLDYLLIVSTVEPRKNHLTLLSAWENLRAERFPNLKLLIVGALGWRQKRIVRKFRPWLERGDAYLLEDVLATELRVLYAQARATVCPSLGEGFDYSGVEAMKSGGPVIASDIAVHREIFLDAAEFFNPYSVEALSRAIQTVIDPAQSGRRDELVARGAIVSARYSHENILPRWQAFLQMRDPEAT
jgi:glycosyltransferase involved in cell wall biosynthesis